MKKKLMMSLGVILGIFLIAIFAIVIRNQIGYKYEDLNETDQFILKELNTYCSHTETQDIWENFKLGDKTVLAIGDSFGSTYLINPKKNISSVFAKKISMPSDYTIKVYRIASIDPQLLQFRIDGNFNSIGETYNFHENDVYYTKYNKEDAVDREFVSTHYITFLSHEAFHYYMQDAWAEGNTYSTDKLTDEDKELLYKEYEVLEKIQTALLEGVKTQEEFLEYAKEYVDVVETRKTKNPEYVKEELERETVEGTATYVGIKASEIVGYDYGVMYFDNVKDIPFSDLKRTVESGAYDKRYLADRIPYETGALLCLLMDELEIPDWQETLNGQTVENQVTLNSIISDFVKTVY